LKVEGTRRNIVEHLPSGTIGTGKTIAPSAVRTHEIVGWNVVVKVVRVSENTGKNQVPRHFPTNDLKYFEANP
jgi:hypothetical protein